MKQILLATTLILVPVAAFTAFTLMAQTPATAAEASLGDMSPFKTIITDVQTIAANGDFTAAEMRITDFESAWDDAAGAMRPLDTTAWGNVDMAADAALDALRASTPAAGDVTGTLATLIAELDNPAMAPGWPPGGAAAATVTPTAVSGIAVTDTNGRALPCEDMLASLTTALATTTVTGATLTAATDFQTKALERCNADDDARADGFSAQALALLAN